MLYLHPRDEQRFRTAKPPTAGLLSFRCKCCGNTIYRSFAPRQRGAWIETIVTHIEHRGDKDFARYELEQRPC